MFADGTLVWVPDYEAKFVPARVVSAFKPGEEGTVALLDDNGQEKFRMKLPSSLTRGLFRMDEESLKPVPDMVELKELNEASILHNLRLRFRSDDIYTNIGDILIALNPFKLLPLYTPLTVESYIRGPAGKTAPHIYKTADYAFTRLIELKKNQACMVTGESGSGKTETTKVFLQYIAEVSSTWAELKTVGEQPKLQMNLSDKILKSNPLLESFGNAWTRKNANSSRFGKLIQVDIDTTTAEIVGAKLTTFLLEKSRLPDQSYGERNFHVFYQLCAGARVHPEIRQEFDVLDQDEYRYLQHTALATKISDLLEWEELNRAMSVLSIDKAQKEEIFHVVSGILHLGNIEFEENATVANVGSSSRVTDATRLSLDLACKQLGLNDLEKSLCLKNVSVGADILFQHQSVERAKKSRDALAIFIYSSLFDYIAAKVNDSLSKTRDKALESPRHAPKASPVGSIGVLDIFGFEGFDGPNNSFEQLCINYCNEKLQHQFNDFVFSREKQEYEKQGIQMKNLLQLFEKEFKTANTVLELFEKPRVGLFHLMDEESAVPAGSDSGLLKKINNEHAGSNPSYSPGRKDLADTTFIVKHYVGPIIYLVTGMLEKNDGGSISKDLHLICSKSTLEIIRTAAPTFKSHLGTQFSNQLDRLVRSLEDMEHQFVRCIKPNPERKGSVFHAAMVLDQLRCAGILEVCKIRQLGYPIRRDFPEFASRYSGLLKRQIAGKDKKAIELLCQYLVSEKIIMDPTSIACGTSKVFMRAAALSSLEQRVEQLRSRAAIKIQRRARGFVARRKIKKLKVQLNVVKDAIKASNLPKLQAALNHPAITRFLENGRHLPVVQQGLKICKSLEEETWGTNLIQKAVQARDTHLIRSALSLTTTIVKQDAAIVLQAKQTLDQLAEEEKCMSDLEQLIVKINTVDFATLNACCQNCEKIKFTGVLTEKQSSFQTNLQKAKAKLSRIKEQEDTRAQLEEALKAKIGARVMLLSRKLRQLGVSEDDPLLQRSLKFLKSEEEDQHEANDSDISHQVTSQDALIALRSAMEQLDADEIAKCLVVAIGSGLESHPDVVKANAKEKMLRRKALDEQELNDAATVLELRTRGDSLNEDDVDIVESVGKRVEDEDLQKRAEQLVQNAQDILEAQNALHAALAIGPSIEMEKLKAALSKAYAVGLKGELLYRVQKLMRSKHRERRLGKKRVVLDVAGDVPEKLGKNVEQLRQTVIYERTREAFVIAEAKSSAGYLLPNYYQIRRRMDGDPPWIKYRGTQVVETSILETTAPGMGEMISKLILGYTGEKSASFPPTCALSLLELGGTNPDLGDEIYCQLCSHLTENPNVESATRTWQLICLSSSCFFPSNDLLLFIIRFLSDRYEGRTDAALGAEHPARSPLATTIDNFTLEQRYAWFAMKRLLTTTTPVLPSIEEIQAFGERIPVVTNVTYPDGSLLLEDVVVSPSMTVQDLTEICLSNASICQTEIHPTYGIFVRPTDKATMQALFLHQQSRDADSAGSKIDETSSRPSSRRLSMKHRFRMSITAVFGFGRGGKGEQSPKASIDEIPDSESESLFANTNDRRRPKVPEQQKKKATTIISVKRTEEEIDWDVPLTPKDFIGDVLLRYLRAGRGAPRLVFKKRIFIPEFEKAAEDVRKADSNPDNATTQIAINKIELLQAIDDFSTGALPFDKEDDVAEVVAARVALKFDNRLPSSDPERLMSIGQVESFIPGPWKAKKSEMNWARVLLEKQAKVNGKDDYVLHQRILERCKARPLYGSQLFRVTKKGDMFQSLLAVNQFGFSLVSMRDHRVCAEYPFNELENFKIGKGGSLVIQQQKSNSEGKAPKPVLFETPNSREIFELAKEYERVDSYWNPKEDTAQMATDLLGDNSEKFEPVTYKSLAELPQETNNENNEPITIHLRHQMLNVGATEEEIATVLRAQSSTNLRG